MNYLIVTTALGYGGAEKLMVQFANEIEATSTTILFLYNIKESEHNLEQLKKSVNIKFLFNQPVNFNSYRFKMQKATCYIFSFPISLWLYRNLIRKHELIHINLSTATFYSIIFNLYKRLSYSKEVYVETFHTNLHLLKWYLKPIFQLNWLLVNKIVYEIGKGDFDNYPIKEKVIFIPFTSRFRNRSKKITNNYRIHKVRLGMLARARRHEKKLDLVIEILEDLNKKDLLESFHFGGDGEDLIWLKNEIKKRGLSDKVKFQGYVENTDTFHYMYDIALAATVDKTPGLSGLESISFGRALLGLASREQTLESDNPLFESSDSKKITDFIIWLIQGDNYTTYCQNLILHFEKESKSNDFIHQYNKLFKQLLSR